MSRISNDCLLKEGIVLDGIYCNDDDRQFITDQWPDYSSLSDRSSAMCLECEKYSNIETMLACNNSNCPGVYHPKCACDAVDNLQRKYSVKYPIFCPICDERKILLFKNDIRSEDNTTVTIKISLSSCNESRRIIEDILTGKSNKSTTEKIEILKRILIHR